MNLLVMVVLLCLLNIMSKWRYDQFTKYCRFKNVVLIFWNVFMLYSSNVLGECLFWCWYVFVSSKQTHTICYVFVIRVWCKLVIRRQYTLPQILPIRWTFLTVWVMCHLFHCIFIKITVCGVCQLFLYILCLMWCP